MARRTKYDTIQVVKSVEFHHEALEVIRRFSEDARKHVGKALYDLQMGATLAMPLSRPMPSVGSGVHELRIRDESGAHRVFYVTKVAGRILVFHAFTKKTQRTPEREIEIGKERLSEMTNKARSR